MFHTQLEREQKVEHMQSLKLPKNNQLSESVTIAPFIQHNLRNSARHQEQKTHLLHLSFAKEVLFQSVVAGHHS